MIKHKLTQSAYVPPLHASSEWIAHNAAMRDKATLLGHGAKPVIGIAYNPKPYVMPAVHVPRHAGVSTKDKITSVACMAAFIAFLAFVSFAGKAAGF